MSRFILSTILILTSLGLFFIFTNPTFSEVKSLTMKLDSQNQALTNFKEFQRVQDILGDKYNNISKENLDKVSKVVPDNVDNIRLIIDLQNVASRHGNMVITNVKFDPVKAEAVAGQTFTQLTPEQRALENKNYNVFDMDFSISGSYENFVAFLKDVEKSLRIVDITALSFSTVDEVSSKTSSSIYKYDLKVKTYWLKN